MSNIHLPLTARGARYAGDMVLDPVAGSGTAAEAALLNQRRFICIDMNADAVRVMVERLAKGAAEGKYKPQVIRGSNRESAVRVITDLANLKDLPYGAQINWDFWNDGNCYIVHGDAIQVMRTMPPSIADLIYVDPPFNAGKVFKGKRGEFDDTWQWDDAAQARHDEIAAITPEALAANYPKGSPLPDLNALQAFIGVSRVLHGDSMASYLTFACLLLLECHRVSGSTSYEPLGFVLPDWVKLEPIVR